MTRGLADEEEIAKMAKHHGLVYTCAGTQKNIESFAHYFYLSGMFYILEMTHAKFFSCCGKPITARDKKKIHRCAHE